MPTAQLRRDIRPYYRQLHRRIHIRYGLLTLDDYLSEEMSQGPKATSGKIDYFYQHYVNIHHYFMIMLREKKEFGIVCVPNFTVQWAGYTDRTAVVYAFKEKKLIYSDKLKKAVYRCVQKDGVRFIYFSLILLPSKKASMTHANIVIIDLKKKTVERFEPYGHDMPGSITAPVIDAMFEKQLMPVLDLKKFTYLPPMKLSPKLGIQSKSDAFCGMCVTITMMYLNMRVFNPDTPQKKLIDYFVQMPKEKLKKTILRYARHVERTLKKNKYTVYDFYEELDKMADCEW